MFVRLSLLTMTNPNQLCDVFLFMCSKMADETNLSSKLPVAVTRQVSNSVDPDQTPRFAHTLFAQTYLCENLG